MKALQNRVAVVTGAGRGLGREHAILLASLGAAVVVNDAGGTVSGERSAESPAAQVVAEIRAAGGAAVANASDISSWEGAHQLIDSAVTEFGALDVLVNNAGILRDRVIVNMEENEWDDVIRVHLKGHFATTHWAARYWRDESKAGRQRTAAIVNTSSVSGTHGGFPGQANYSAAKAAILALSMSSALELERYGVRTNAIVPAARTRITDTTSDIAARLKAPDDPEQFDRWHPGNVSPIVAMLSAADCPFNGRVFYISGGVVGHLNGWSPETRFEKDSRWTVDELSGRFAGTPPRATFDKLF